MKVRIAVIADSHFHPAGVPTQAVWASDRVFNARNAVAVELVERARPSLVVHLGDVVHPIPGLPEHEGALAEARRIYQPLSAPLHVVPGNHDVGDKPHPWAPAPSVSAAKHGTFGAWWGPPWWAVEHQGLRLLGIDTPVLNSGLPLEAEQWAWLASLRPGPRTFAFVHYPPFLLRPDEGEHYDNLAEPGRSRLLAELERLGCEVLCCGHVHHPFWNRHGAMDCYLLPSTAFVRPEYSELGRIGPGAEYGRDDADRLGFCLLDIDEHGHEVSWIRTDGAVVAPPAEPGLNPGETRPDNPLGLTLRHAWDAVLDLPADGLEPFRRKKARNDLVLLGTWELGVRLLRLPFDDLRDPDTRARLSALGRRGQQVVLYSAEPLTDLDRALVAEHAHAIVAVEHVVPRALLDRPIPALAVPRWVAALGRASTETGPYFSHFAPQGFVPGDADLGRADADGFVFRIEPDVDPVEVVPRLRAQAGDRVVAAVVLLPRGGESHRFEDDAAIEARVRRAFLAARDNPAVRVMLDTTTDQDRGYFPRNGLLDRAGHPRAAFRSLARWARGAG